MLKERTESSKKNKLAHEILSEQGNSGLITVADNELNKAGDGDCVSEKSAKNLANIAEKRKQADEKQTNSKKENELTKILPAKEMYSLSKYENVGEALNVFKDDELIHKPGKRL